MRRRDVSARLVLALLFFVSSALFAQAEARPKTLRVLFIGNSYTYLNNLPGLLEKIAAGEVSGPAIEAEGSLSGGKSLEWHWEQGQALAAIRKGGWDFVVLQEFSTLSQQGPRGGAPRIGDPDAYFKYATLFHDEIQKAGARTVVYATWARDGYPEQQRRLDDAFVQFARKVNAGIVPAGLAWTVTRLEAPSIRLYTPDRSHPTAAGSYLNALLFYQCLTGRPANHAPSVITGTDWNKHEELTLVNLTLSDALTLNQIAQRVVAQEPLRPVQ
ncbi:MAG: SGNH/GDSL hydrolase family protein [Bryobacterales bacterium]|nr:SGNH/GDSL hydrolase family protein [Bryobacterales bacterium]